MSEPTTTLPIALEGIADELEQHIQTYYDERAGMAQVSEARSVARRQQKVDKAISDISALVPRLRALVPPNEIKEALQNEDGSGQAESKPEETDGSSGAGESAAE